MKAWFHVCVRCQRAVHMHKQLGRIIPVRCKCGKLIEGY